MSKKKYLLGCDIGSSSVKAIILNADSGKAAASAFAPDSEMEIHAPQKGWAEQHPDTWWTHLVASVRAAMKQADASPDEIAAIGITYQMHGLVIVDKDQNVLRPSIIWCDSRATAIGRNAFEEIGPGYCLEHYLNSPGNFTASKLKWVMDNEPEIYERIHKIMLPGDFIGMRMTGTISTTLTGLSEGVLWDYPENRTAHNLMKYYGIADALIPKALPSFDLHGELTGSAAKELGLKKGTPITYKAGDQPNNAFSLNVLQPGEVAATAGTSGVIYGVTDKPMYDQKSRVNTFIHVNSREGQPMNGVLLCVNGTGILNSWMKHNMSYNGSLGYDEMNRLALEVPVGSDGLTTLPFGNGAERILENRVVGAQVLNLDFNRHNNAHLFRSAQEGIVFALNYGFQIIHQMGLIPETVKAGRANMFQSPLFREAFVNTTRTVLELYKTDGAEGAARGAGVGSGVFASETEAFHGLEKLEVIKPDSELMKIYNEHYQNWLEKLNQFLT
jgi:xylulokinase